MARERNNRKPAPRRAETKKESSALTVVLLAAILLMAGFLAYFFLFSESGFLYARSGSGRFAEALSQNNYQAAATLWKEAEEKGRQETLRGELSAHTEEYFALCFLEEYTADTWTRYRGLEVFKEEIEPLVYAKLEAITAAFYRGEYTVEEAKTYLSRVGRFGFAAEQLEQAVDEVAHKAVSDKAFAEGSAFYSAGEYAKAAAELHKVSPRDEQKYASAQELLKNCLEAYGQPKFEEARQLFENGVPAAAAEILKELLKIFPEFTQAQDLLRQCG